MTNPKINQLQLLQQNLQQTQMQKQQMQNQIAEFDSALTELKTAEKAYKIVGNIMIASSQEELVKDIEEKKEIASLRVKSFVKQEESLRKNLEEIQKEVLEEMGHSQKKGKSSN